MRGSGGNTVCPRELLRSAGYYARGLLIPTFLYRFVKQRGIMAQLNEIRGRLALITGASGG